MILMSNRLTTAPDVMDRNAILAGLSRNSIPRLGSRLRTLHCESGTVLHEWREPVMDAYFPITAVISLFATSLEGNLIEAAIVGPEGVVGFLEAVTKNTLPFQAVVQVGGEVCRVSAEAAAAIYRDDEAQRRVAAYLNVLMTQLGRLAICNSRHTVEQRLARWLLTMRARTGLADFPTTHEMLSHILGTTRPVVTIAARALKTRKLIAYRRGTVHIKDPRGLAEASCHCYDAVHRELATFLKSCKFVHPFWNSSSNDLECKGP